MFSKHQHLELTQTPTISKSIKEVEVFSNFLPIGIFMLMMNSPKALGTYNL
jgi:hypothetical protein